MYSKKYTQKGGDFPGPWGDNLPSYYSVGQPNQYSQQGGKTNVPTKEETDHTCKQCEKYKAGREAHKEEISNQKAAEIKAAEAKCLSAKSAAQIKIEEIKANAQARLESELSEAKIDNEKDIIDGCKNKESLIHNAREEKIQDLVSKYENKVRTELENAGVSKSDAKIAAQTEASTLLNSSNSEIVISDDTQTTSAVENALNKLSGDVNVVYIDKDWPGNSNYTGADTATLQAAAEAISSGTFLGDTGTTGAVVFSGGGKYYVHNPKNRKNYKENTKSIIGKKLVGGLLKKLKVNKLAEIKKISNQVGGNLYFPKEKIIYLSKGGAMEEFYHNNLGYVYQTQGGKSRNSKRRSKRNSRRSQRKSNRNSRKSQKRRQRRSLRRNQRRRTRRRRSQNNKK